MIQQHVTTTKLLILCSLMSKQVSEWQLGCNSNDSHKIDLDTF